MLRFNFDYYYQPLLLILGVTRIQQVSTSDKNMQEFILYTEKYPASQYCNRATCESRSFNGNLKDLTQLWGRAAHNTVKSWCSATQGMWLFFSDTNFSPNSSYSGFVKTSRPDSDRTRSSVMQCVNLPKNQGIRSIRHFAHANLSIPAMTLFTLDYDSGTLQKEFFIDGEAVSLPAPMTFAAYAFSGFEPWTIFDQVNFRGSTTCLNLPRDFDPKQNSDVALLSAGINVDIILGSARLGCSGDEDYNLYPLNSTTAVLNLGDSLTLFFEHGSRNQQSQPDAVNETIIIDELPNDDIFPPPAFIVTVRDMGSGNNNSTSQIYFSGLELVLPDVYNVTSFLPINPKRNVTMEGHWELCSDLDFTGICTCLLANNTNIAILEPDIIFMSARFGCSVSKEVGKGGGSRLILQQYTSFLIFVIITIFY
ncbi:uncharacterized protein LOC110845568 [Folsomia candida]|nr:uncharacterized protein LOC110845568 [Folsomia candida]